MNSKDLFDKEVELCGDGRMSPEERRAAYGYFLRGMHVNRLFAPAPRTYEQEAEKTINAVQQAHEDAANSTLRFGTYEQGAEDMRERAYQVCQLFHEGRDTENQEKFDDICEGISDRIRALPTKEGK